MKKSYDMVWAESAEKDLYGIIQYIARDHLSRAAAILNKIQRKTSSLYHSPTRGRVIPELREQGVLQYRELIISPWRVMYRIEGKRILVVGVLDSRRNVEDILFERILNLE